MHVAARVGGGRSNKARGTKLSLFLLAAAILLTSSPSLFTAAEPAQQQQQRLRSYAPSSRTTQATTQASPAAINQQQREEEKERVLLHADGTMVPASHQEARGLHATDDGSSFIISAPDAALPDSRRGDPNVATGTTSEPAKRTSEDRAYVERVTSNNLLTPLLSYVVAANFIDGLVEDDFLNCQW